MKTKTKKKKKTRKKVSTGKLNPSVEDPMTSLLNKSRALYVIKKISYDYLFERISIIITTTFYTYT